MKPKDLKAIMDHLKKDPEVAARVNSFLDDILPDSWGQAGNLRNWGYILSGEDASDPEIAAKVCYGISKITSEKIREEIEKGENFTTYDVMKEMQAARLRQGWSRRRNWRLGFEVWDKIQERGEKEGCCVSIFSFLIFSFSIATVIR